MQVTSTAASANTTSNTPQASSSSASATLDYDAFLRLLIAQMKYQDPTKPMDPSQQMSQLASFSNVEQSIKMNAKLDALMTSVNLSQADGMIGRTITSSDGSVSGTIAAVRVTSDGLVAHLADGRELAIGPGITIS